MLWYTIQFMMTPYMRAYNHLLKLSLQLHVKQAATNSPESSNQSLTLNLAEDSRYVAQHNHSTLPQQGSHSPGRNANHQLGLECVKEPLPYSVPLWTQNPPREMTDSCCSAI